MNLKHRQLSKRLVPIFSLLLLSACGNNPTHQGSRSGVTNLPGFEVKLLVGSALGEFCKQATAQFNQQQPKLDNGTAFHVTCEAKGSGDVVADLMALASQFKAGTLPADSPEFPTLVSVDGEIYQSQLLNQMNQLFPSQKYIPEITDSPLIANSPMVFMATTDVAKGLRKATNPFKVLARARTHRDIDPSGPPIAIHYVHTAPTRSNSGLQTLVAQFASVSGKQPLALTIEDVKRYQPAANSEQSHPLRGFYRFSSSGDGAEWTLLGICWLCL